MRSFGGGGRGVRVFKRFWGEVYSKGQRSKVIRRGRNLEVGFG